MGKSCCENKSSELEQLRQKQAHVLKLVLGINAVMFLAEFVAGILAKSSALKADSLDMLGDAIVYGFSLYVLHRSYRWKSMAAFLKGMVIVGFAIFVLVETTFKVFSDFVPVAETMVHFGALAFAANLVCFYLLWKHREDDVNMRSTFICSRNDIISNSGVLVAAGLVWLLQSKWPDVIVGYSIALLFLFSAWPILVEAMAGLRSGQIAKSEDLRNH